MLWLDLFEHSYMANFKKKLSALNIFNKRFLPSTILYFSKCNICYFQYFMVPMILYITTEKKGHIINDNTNLSNLSFVKRMKHDRCSNLAIIKSQILIHTCSFSLRIHLTFGAATWFPCQMTSEKRAQKFHTDDASLPRTGSELCF